MKRVVALAVVGFVLTTVSGCGSKAENLIKSSISQMNDLAAAIENKESPEKIKSLAEKLKATGDELRKLDPPKEEQEKLRTKYEADLKAAMERMKKAVASNPDAMKGMAGAMGGP